MEEHRLVQIKEALDKNDSAQSMQNFLTIVTRGEVESLKAFLASINFTNEQKNAALNAEVCIIYLR